MAKIIEVIKYEGDNQTFAWKHPAEDFNTSSQLIVHENQEAILFANGQMCDSFGPGRHTLTSENIPLLRRIINIPSGGESFFHCEVYFVNLVDQMAIRWGTDSRVQYMDPEYNFPLSIGANGEMALTCSNPRILLKRLVGTETKLSRDSLVVYLRSILMLNVKTYIAQQIKKQRINIFELDEHISEFSRDIKSLLEPDFEEYGIKLSIFNITGFAKPENDPIYIKFKELYFRQYADIAEAKLKKNVDIIHQEAEKEKMIIEAEGLSQKRRIEGYSYQEERGLDIAEKAAANEGAGAFTSMGIGLGVMGAVGGAVSHNVNNAMNNAINPNPTTVAKFCENCGNPIDPSMKFCENCGHKLQNEDICRCGYKFTKPSKFCPNCGTKRGE